MPMMQPMGIPGAPMFPPQAAAHAQMVFTTTQRSQPKMGGQQTRTYNILPMISFKVCRRWRMNAARRGGRQQPFRCVLQAACQ